MSDRKQGPPIAQGRGPCDKCGAGLHVLGEEFSAFVASIGGDPAATGVAEGLELGGGYVLTVAQPGGGYHCPKCGHPGVFTPLTLHQPAGTETIRVESSKAPVGETARGTFGLVQPRPWHRCQRADLLDTTGQPGKHGDEGLFLDDHAALPGLSGFPWARAGQNLLVIVAASTVAVVAIVVAILAIVLLLAYFQRGRRRRLQGFLLVLWPECRPCRSRPSRPA